MKKFLAGAATAALMTLATAGSANAAVLMFDFMLDGTNGGAQNLPPTPPAYGTVTVNDAGGLLSFNVQLASGFYFFHDTVNPAHNAFDFIVAKAVTEDLPLPAGFSWAAGGPFAAPAITQGAQDKEFNHAIACPVNCAGGAIQLGLNSLSFTVSDAANDLTVNDLGHFTNPTFPGANIYFAADISNVGGTITGNVGAVLSAVPEPSTWALMIAGFGLIGFAMRRRPKQEGAFA